MAILNTKELAVLGALDRNRGGLYGSDFKAATGGAVGVWSIYTVLEALVDAGWVREQQEPPEEGCEAGRTRHFITEGGIRALSDAQTAPGDGLAGLPA